MFFLAQSSRNPTLLHFAARYNFIQLSMNLLTCPGSKEALQMKNVDGHTPYQVALQCSNVDLARLLVCCTLIEI